MRIGKILEFGRTASRLAGRRWRDWQFHAAGSIVVDWAAQVKLSSWHLDTVGVARSS